MTILAVSKLESTLLANRVRTFVEQRGFSKIQPTGWVKENVFDLHTILCSTKNNFPYGFCPANERYISNVQWNWANLPKDLPIDKLAFSLVLGVECYSTCVLQNVSRKKIKMNDKWTHRLCNTGCWYNELTSTVDLSKYTDEEIIQSIKIAQDIIDVVCVVEFTDEAAVFDENRTLRGYKYEARRILSSMYMLDISTEMPLCINDRIEFLKMPKQFAYKSQRDCELAYSQYFSKLLDRLPVKTVADLMLDLMPSHYDIHIMTHLMIAVLLEVDNKQLSKELFSVLQPVIAKCLDDHERLVQIFESNKFSPEDLLAFERTMPNSILTKYLDSIV